MATPLTAKDLLPLVRKLDHDEQVRLAKLALRAAASRPSDAAAYRASTPGTDEFADEDDPLSWDAGGWDEVDAPR
jgi:hypothetical protein